MLPGLHVHGFVDDIPDIDLPPETRDDVGNPRLQQLPGGGQRIGLEPVRRPGKACPYQGMSLGGDPVEGTPFERLQHFMAPGHALCALIAGPVKWEYAQVEYSLEPFLEQILAIGVLSTDQVKQDTTKEEIVRNLLDLHHDAGHPLPVAPAKTD